MYRADLQKIAGYTVLLRQTVRCVEDSYHMEGYPSLVKGTVLKTVRSFAARGFEPHTFLLADELSFIVIECIFYLFHADANKIHVF